MLVLALIVFPCLPAAAFDPGGVTLPTGTYWYYKVDSSFTSAGFLLGSLYQAEQAWKIYDLTSRGQFYNNNSLGGSRVIRADLSNPGPDAWASSTTCVPGCSMTFYLHGGNGQAQWNTTTEIRPSPWLDFISVAAHEFGHWVGLDHACNPEQIGNGACGREPIVASDSSDYFQGNSAHTMYAWLNPGETYQRTIAENDADGFLWDRNTMLVAPDHMSNILVNHSFEAWGSPFTGWAFFGNPSYTHICGSYSPPEGQCYETFSSPNTSIFQDFLVHRGTGGYSIPGNNLNGFVWIRPGGNYNAQVTFALWSLGSSNSNVYSVCNASRNGYQWTQCTVDSRGLYVSSGIYYQRAQVYSNYAGWLDLDSLTMERD